MVVGAALDVVVVELVVVDGLGFAPPVSCANMLFMAARLGIPVAFGALPPLPPPVVVFVPLPVVLAPDRGPHGFGNGCVFSVPACPFLLHLLLIPLYSRVFIVYVLTVLGRLAVVD